MYVFQKKTEKNKTKYKHAKNQKNKKTKPPTLPTLKKKYCYCLGVS